MLDKYEDESKKSFLRLIDTQKNSIVEEHKLNLSKTYSFWFKDKRILLITSRDIRGSYNEKVEGRSQFLKVTEKGVVKNDLSLAWLDFLYLEKQDVLVILTNSHLDVINYQNNTYDKYKTGLNTFVVGNMIYSYQINAAPDSNMIVITSFKRRKVKFFDLEQKKVVKQVKCGRSKLSLFCGDAKPMVTTTSAKDHYFILNQASNDISIYDQSLELINIIPLPEPALGMYQIEKPTLQTLLTTEKIIYKLDLTNYTLSPIYEFKQKSEKTILFNDENHLFIYSGLELLVLDSDSLKVKNSFQLLGDPNEKYTKVKKGGFRYYFIKTI